MAQSLQMSALLEDKFMRVLLLFDLPTTSKKEQKNAAKFRNELIKLGFFMMQFSVYMRICKGLVSANAVISRVRGILPPLGNVRALIITEKQFDNMQILLGSAGFNESVNDDKNLVLFAFDEKIGDYRYLSNGQGERDEGAKRGENLDKKTCENENAPKCENLDFSKGENTKKEDFANKSKRKKPQEQSLFEF